jgi:hypothetical protein
LQGDFAKEGLAHQIMEQALATNDTSFNNESSEDKNNLGEVD